MQPAKHATIAGRRTPALRSALLATTALAFVASNAGPASAGELQDLKAQIEELQRKLEQLEEQQKKVPPPEKIVTEGDVPGSFKVPGTNTSISFGGYVKFDSIYDLDGFAGPSMYFSALPFEDEPEADRQAGFLFHGRQSRINFKTHTPSDLEFLGKRVDFDTHIEFDFLKSSFANEVLSNSNVPRLRHAYGRIGPLLIGQTWSTFNDIDAYPWTVDFFGPAGFSFIRQPQIRYTHDLGGGTTVSVALENPELVASSPVVETDVLDSAGDVIGTETSGGAGVVGTGPVGGSDGVFDRVPDFAANVRHEADWGWVQLAGVARDLAIDVEPDELGDGAPGGTDDEFGWGVHLSTVFSVPQLPNATFGAVGIYGEGVGRYIISQGFNLGDAELITSGPSVEVEALEAWSASGWVQYNWTDDIWSVVAYGREDTEVPATLGFDVRDTTSDWINSVHVNTMWNIGDRVTMGVEYVRGWAETATNRKREANRLQFGTWWWF